VRLHFPLSCRQFQAKSLFSCLMACLFQISVLAELSLGQESDPKLKALADRIPILDEYACVMLVSSLTSDANKEALYSADFTIVRAYAKKHNFEYYACHAHHTVFKKVDELDTGDSSSWQESFIEQDDEHHYINNSVIKPVIDPNGVRRLPYPMIDPIVMANWQYTDSCVGIPLNYIKEMLANGLLLKSYEMDNGDIHGIWNDLPNRTTAIEFHLSKDFDLHPSKLQFRRFDGESGKRGSEISKSIITWKKIDNNLILPIELSGIEFKTQERVKTFAVKYLWIDPAELPKDYFTAEKLNRTHFFGPFIEKYKLDIRQNITLNFPR